MTTLLHYHVGIRLIGLAVLVTTVTIAGIVREIRSFRGPQARTCSRRKVCPKWLEHGGGRRSVRLT